MRPHFNNTGVETQEASIPTTKNKTKRDFKPFTAEGLRLRKVSITAIRNKQSDRGRILYEVAFIT